MLQAIGKASMVTATIIITACNSGPTGALEPTSLVFVQPAGGSAKIDPDSSIFVMFSRPLMPGAEMYAAVHQGDIRGPVITGTWNWSTIRETVLASGSRRPYLLQIDVLTFTPVQQLERETRYTLHLGGGIRDRFGRAIDYESYGHRRLGGEWVTAAMLISGTADGASPHTQPGWQHANGTYGMAFTFTTE